MLVPKFPGYVVGSVVQSDGVEISMLQFNIQLRETSVVVLVLSDEGC